MRLYRQAGCGAWLYKSNRCFTQPTPLSPAHSLIPPLLPCSSSSPSQKLIVSLTSLCRCFLSRGFCRKLIMHR